jgi:hypothetical protein
MLKQALTRTSRWFALLGTMHKASPANELLKNHGVLWAHGLSGVCILAISLIGFSNRL